MPRKHQDPVVGVVDYFETATLEAAKTTLEIVSHIVKRRSPAAPVKPAKTPKAGKTPKAPAVPGPTTTVGE